MKNLLLLSAAALLLASCDDRVRSTRTVYTDEPAYQEQPVYATPSQPVYGGGTTVIHDHDDNGSGLVTGMILGHMLSSSGNNSGGGYSGKRTKKTTIINNTYHAPARPVSRPSYSAPRPSYRPSPFRSSSSMGSRAVRRR